MDLFGCSLLHSKYHALVHYLNRSILVATLPDALRTKQDSSASCVEDIFCVAAVDRHELTVELNVF